MAGVNCKECDAILDEPDNIQPAERQPCPQCGSTSRRFSVEINSEVKLRSGLGMKAKRPGQKKPYYENYSGPDYSYSRGKQVEKNWTIDRDNDEYSELVTDYETGEVIHHCDEKLSEHKGHGSAKN